MANKNNKSNSNQQNSGLTSKNQNGSFASTNDSNFKSVEPLPESSRPRRDGPGGEDGE